MSLAFIPPAHLKHLLKAALEAKNVTGDDYEDWLDKLTATHPLAKSEVLTFIDSAFPNTSAQLEDTWPFQGQRAVLMWRLVYLKGKSIADALANQPAFSAFNDGAWIKLNTTAKQQVNAQVHAVRVRNKEVEAEVWMTKEFEFVQYGEPKKDFRTQPILTRISFDGHDTPLAEAYASIKDGREALYSVVDWLTGNFTPRMKTPAQEKLLIPITFTEKQIDTLAKHQKWKPPTQVRGLQAKKEVGEIELNGHKKGFDTAPLNTTVPMVHDQLKSKNDLRRYKTPFSHPDGFAETPRPTFYFKGLQPHIQFNTRTSRPAMDALLAVLLAELGV